MSKKWRQKCPEWKKRLTFSSVSHHHMFLGTEEVCEQHLLYSWAVVNLQCNELLKGIPEDYPFEWLGREIISEWGGNSSFAPPWNQLFCCLYGAVLMEFVVCFMLDYLSYKVHLEECLGKKLYFSVAKTPCNWWGSYSLSDVALILRKLVAEDNDRRDDAIFNSFVWGSTVGPLWKKGCWTR